MACVVPRDEEVNLVNTNLPALEIQECLCVTFKIEGKHQDILNLIQWVYHEWLPNSGYETITIPSYMIFETNHFVKEDGVFKGILFLPLFFAIYILLSAKAYTSFQSPKSLSNSAIPILELTLNS